MKKYLATLLIFAAAPVLATEITVKMDLVDEKGPTKAIGQVVISESEHGLVFTPALEGLPAGPHGFHVHENPSCAPGEKDGKVAAAIAAGSHLGHGTTAQHGAPWGKGHLGDLPLLVVNSDGKANTPVLSPRLKMNDVKGRAMMIHAGSDNYSDQPAPLGGGGARIACGAIEK